MRLIIVRHGDPNYEIDSLTEKGWREAEFLSVRMEKQLQKEHTYIYTSPLGRAKDTASLTLKKLGMTATEFKWLREFEARRLMRILVLIRFAGICFLLVGQVSRHIMIRISG